VEGEIRGRQERRDGKKLGMERIRKERKRECET
jgi:hypothetical protein